MIEVQISPETRQALLDWCQEVLTAGDTEANDLRVCRARVVLRHIERGCLLILDRTGVDDLLHAMWACNLGGCHDANEIRRAARMPLYELAESEPAESESAVQRLAIREFRETVAIVIDAVQSLGPANDPNAARRWAENRIEVAREIFVDNFTAAAARGGGGS